jgi:hypothetical protein
MDPGLQRFLTVMMQKLPHHLLGTSFYHQPAEMTHPQFLEGPKEESQVEDNGKREGVGACSLTHSTRGVEGRVGAPGLGLGRVTSLIHLLQPASNQPQSG